MGLTRRKLALLIILTQYFLVGLKTGTALPGNLPADFLNWYQTIMRRVAKMKSVTTDQYNLKYMKIAEKIFGVNNENHEATTADKTSIFGIITFKYHFHVTPEIDKHKDTDGSSLFNRNVKEILYDETNMKSIRRFQNLFISAEKYVNKCENISSTVQAATDYREVEDDVEFCLNNKKMIQITENTQELANQLFFLIWSGYTLMQSVDILMIVYHNFFAHENSQFNLMMNDVDQTYSEIEADLNSLIELTNHTDEFIRKQARDNIKILIEKINTEPYSYLTTTKSMASLKSYIKTEQDNNRTIADLTDIPTPDVITNMKNALANMKTRIEELDAFDWPNKIEEYKQVYDFDQLKAVTESTASNIFTNMEEIYTEFLEVDPDPGPKFLDFERQGFDPSATDDRTSIHALRVAWEWMDELSEQIKIYANKTYYGNLREEAIANAQVDLKDENRKLFNTISTTYGKPCKTKESDGDIVGMCTKENHEICSPHPLTEYEDPTDELKGGLGVLKPKTIFVKNPKSKQYEKKKTYVIKFKTCQCGFRTDCGDDLGEKINCILQVNDEKLLKQCRGSIGYPCKTLPLAPGKFHESCVTGYCDMEANSCEKGDWRKGVDMNENGSDGLKGCNSALGLLILTIIFSFSFIFC